MVHHCPSWRSSCYDHVWFCSHQAMKKAYVCMTLTYMRLPCFWGLPPAADPPSAPTAFPNDRVVCPFSFLRGAGAISLLFSPTIRQERWWWWRVEVDLLDQNFVIKETLFHTLRCYYMSYYCVSINGGWIWLKKIGIWVLGAQNLSRIWSGWRWGHNHPILRPSKCCLFSLHHNLPCQNR